MPRTHYNRENNELVDFSLLQQECVGWRRPKVAHVVKRLSWIIVIAAGVAATVWPQIAQAQHSAEAGAIAESAVAREADTRCGLPSEPWGIPAALDGAISGPADKDRACMRALLLPDARITFVSVGADGVTTYRLLSLDDWIARAEARGHVIQEEKQLSFHIDQFANIAHLWSLYAVSSGGHAVARGMNSIQAIKEAGGWRVTAIMLQAESPAAPLPEKYVP